MSNQSKASLKVTFTALGFGIAYLLFRELAFQSRVAEIILQPGGQDKMLHIILLLVCILFRLTSTLLIPGMLVARLWWIWTKPE